MLPGIRELERLILRHKSLYYSGNPSISDAEYDALEERLRLLSPHSPVLDVVGTAAPAAGQSTKKVIHNPPMLSLAKTYDPQEVLQFLREKKGVVSHKLDGMALSLEYDASGRFCRASTRGNGREGEDATAFVQRISRVPLLLPFSQLQNRKQKQALDDFCFEVRGEVYFPQTAFLEFTDLFDSPRNAIAGIFGRKEIDERLHQVLGVLDFCAYDCMVRVGETVWSPGELMAWLGVPEGHSPPSFFQKLEHLELWGFTAGVAQKTTFLISSADLVSQDVNAFFMKHLNHSFDYQTDGLVLRYDDEDHWQQLGHTAHHPRGSLAFKQSAPWALTRILGIETAMGRSGKVSFRARLEPVYLSGAQISYASLHNAQFVESGPYAPGAVVKIQRSGEVIPSILSCEHQSEQAYDLPQKCPCGFDLVRKGPDLFCLVDQVCPPKSQELFVHFVKVWGMKGLSDKLVQKLCEANLVKEPADFFRLKASDLLELDGFAQKLADNIVAEIQSHLKVSLGVFLGSLSLTRGGIVKCKQVAALYRNWDTVKNLDAETLGSNEGWAQKSAADFVQSLQQRLPWAETLLNFVTISDEAPRPSSSSSLPYGSQPVSSGVTPVLGGKSVCMTGDFSLPRRVLVEQLESQGAKVVSGVSAKTHFLICNQASGSSKYAAALKYGVTILNEQELFNLIPILKIRSGKAGEEE